MVSVFRLEAVGTIRYTVGSGLFGPLVDWPGAWFLDLVCASAWTDTKSPSEFHLDSSQVFNFRVITGRDIVIILHLVERCQMS